MLLLPPGSFGIYFSDTAQKWTDSWQVSSRSYVRKEYIQPGTQRDQNLYPRWVYKRAYNLAKSAEHKYGCLLHCNPFPEMFAPGRPSKCTERCSGKHGWCLGIYVVFSCPPTGEWTNAFSKIQKEKYPSTLKLRNWSTHSPIGNLSSTCKNS